MKSNQKPSRDRDMRLINDYMSGKITLKQLKDSFRDLAAHQETQVACLLGARESPIMGQILLAYLEVRRLGKQAFTCLLAHPSLNDTDEFVVAALADSAELPKLDLSVQNEKLLIDNFPQFLENYLKISLKGYLSEEAVEYAEEIGFPRLEHIMELYPRPVEVHATTSLGDLFTPEMRAMFSGLS